MRMKLMGMKTRYYVNSKTNTGKQDKKVEEQEDVGCASGGCTL